MAETVELDARDPRLFNLISQDAWLEPLASGFQFLEGPIWLAGEHALVFSDIPGDTLYRWSAPAGRATVFRQPSHKANGNTLDECGRILTCEHATSRLVRQELDGAIAVLASHYAGLELNSPNDVVVKSDGSIYFTDPNFGRRLPNVGIVRPQQQPCQAVYRLDPRTGDLARLADDFEQPNGLCFSADESRLFVNDSARGHIRVCDVLSNGALREGQVWAELHGAGRGGPDGMKFDVAGNLYCAGPGGIHIFDPYATCLGVLRVPEQTANFCWGGAEGRDLFVCASTTLYRVRVQVPGRLAPARSA